MLYLLFIYSIFTIYSSYAYYGHTYYIYACLHILPVGAISILSYVSHHMSSILDEFFSVMCIVLLSFWEHYTIIRLLLHYYGCAITPSVG